MLPSSESLPCLVLALCAVLLSMLPAQDALWRWEHAHAEPAKPTLMPWLVLAALALASCTLGITHPLEVAAAFGGQPRSLPSLVLALRP